MSTDTFDRYDDTIGGITRHVNDVYLQKSLSEKLSSLSIGSDRRTAGLVGSAGALLLDPLQYCRQFIAWNQLCIRQRCARQMDDRHGEQGTAEVARSNRVHGSLISCKFARDAIQKKFILMRFRCKRRAAPPGNGV